jgi:hypothetical protein
MLGSLQSVDHAPAHCIVAIVHHWLHIRVSADGYSCTGLSIFLLLHPLDLLGSCPTQQLPNTMSVACFQCSPNDPAVALRTIPSVSCFEFHLASHGSQLDGCFVDMVLWNIQTQPWINRERTQPSRTVPHSTGQTCKICTRTFDMCCRSIADGKSSCLVSTSTAMLLHPGLRQHQRAPQGQRSVARSVSCALRSSFRPCRALHSQNAAAESPKLQQQHPQWVHTLMSAAVTATLLLQPLSTVFTPSAWSMGDMQAETEAHSAMGHMQAPPGTAAAR